MVTKNSNLVRPRTIMQESNLQRTNPNNLQSKTKSKNSFIVLSLVGACLFLLILCGCLITALVLIGKNLSAGGFVLSTKNFNSNSSVANKQLPSVNGHSDSDFDRMNISSKVIEQLGWRLPREIRPTLYNLLIHPDLNGKTFTGNIAIHLRVVKPISHIAVHSKKLTITDTTLNGNDTGTGGTNIPIFQTFEYPKYEYWITEVNEPLAVGSYVLGLKFNGSLTDRIVGLYQSSYFDKSRNETRTMATSKFEPTYARQAYPCFDEPSMKAEFKISLVRPRDYIALSNMNEERTITNEDGTDTVEFAKSVPMSTYLSCFIVSDFEYRGGEINSNGIGENVAMRVFAPRAQLQKVDFALEIGIGVTEYYIDYFQVEYPLPKLDMVAIPDFVSGAMEHWGLVTFRETALLYDPTISSTSNQQRVATVVAHELAHMWFGNLVTMAWWNELWLNEGFASFIEYKGVNRVRPNWGMLDQFLVDDLHGVLRLDATLASHPIVQVAESPDQITELFDTITYSKGSSIIRMLEDFVGPDNFKLSVTDYLNSNKFGNAVTDDLLTKIDNLNLDFDVKYVIDTWIKQSGFPVVNVTFIPPNQYRLTQQRFLSNPENENEPQNDSEYNYRWEIPITYQTDDDSEVKRLWFAYLDSEAIIPVNETHRWIKLNKNQVGYYRVNYPIEMWQTLTDVLVENIDTFSISDRAHLLNDAFSLAEATQLPYSVALELTKYLANEEQYVPWSVASSKLSDILRALYYTDIYSQFSNYSHTVITKAYETAGWTVGEDHLTNLLRTTILGFACSSGLPHCIDEAGRQFNEWLAEPATRPHPDLRNLIYYYGMASQGNEAKWNIVWELFKNETDASEKQKLMYGLSAIQDIRILRNYVELAWNDTNVRSQDYFTCIQYIASNRIGESVVWEYVRSKWPAFVGRFGLNERYLGRMIPSITGRFNSEVRLDEVRHFFADYPLAGAGAAARIEAIENITNNIKWLENNKQSIGDWLNQASE